MGKGVGLEQMQQEQTSGTTGDLLREIHHQVKNNLQLVCSLIRIQARSLSTYESKAILRRSEERIQSMALVYDMLYRGALFEGVPIKPYVSELAKTLIQGAAVGGAVAGIECRIEPVFVSAKVATYLGLLVNEALSHRLRQSGVAGEPSKIILDFSLRNGAMFFELQDNGPTASESIGISEVEHQILDALVRQLEGALQYPTGERFSMQITLPLRALGLEESTQQE